MDVRKRKTFTYIQDSGLILDETGNTVAKGWAGHGPDKNNPASQGSVSKGPLPCGLYAVGYWHDHPRLGPLAAELIQVEGEDFGRDAFFMHGASNDPQKFGQESEGCVVTPRVGRQQVANNKPWFVKVIATQEVKG